MNQVLSKKVIGHSDEYDSDDEPVRVPKYSDEYHPGKIEEYLGFMGFGRKQTFKFGFDDKTEEIVHGYDYRAGKDSGNIQVVACVCKHYVRVH